MDTAESAPLSVVLSLQLGDGKKLSGDREKNMRDIFRAELPAELFQPAREVFLNNLPARSLGVSLLHSQLDSD